MKKLIITEIEKRRILNLYEKVGDPLPDRSLQSQKGTHTKYVAKILNDKYGLNLNAVTTGNWQDVDFNNALKKFMEENGIPVHVCKTGDGFCADDSDGEITAGNEEDMKKLFDALYGTNTEQVSTVTDEKINTTNDRDYDYKLSGGKYYFKGKQGRASATKYPNWVEAKGNALAKIKEIVKF